MGVALGGVMWLGTGRPEVGLSMGIMALALIMWQGVESIMFDILDEMERRT